MSEMEKSLNPKKPDDWIKQYGNYMAIAAVVCALLVILILGGKPGRSETVSAGTDVIGLDGARETETTAGVSPLRADAHPEINLLVNTYFTALKEQDVETLNSIVESSAEITEESVRKANELIEDYRNIKCYTKDGIIDGTYVVFVYYDVKFQNVETPAPSMYRTYICTNEDGSLYMNQVVPEGEVTAYMDELQKSDEVVQLYDSVNDAFTAAMEQDEKLSCLIAMMREGNVPDVAQMTESQTPEVENGTAEEGQSGVSDTGETGETVYAMQNVNIRKDPSTEGELAGQLLGGMTIQRIGTEGDWSKVIYGGETCYIASEFLTTDDISGSFFREVDEQVEALQNVRIRKEPSTDSEETGMLAGGTEVRRTGYNDTWSRVVYNDETGYVASEFLR